MQREHTKTPSSVDVTPFTTAFATAFASYGASGATARQSSPGRRLECENPDLVLTSAILSTFLIEHDFYFRKIVRCFDGLFDFHQTINIFKGSNRW